VSRHRASSRESVEFPTDVKEVVTLLGNSREAISSTRRVSVTSGMYAISRAFKRHMQGRFLDLANRVGRGHVWGMPRLYEVPRVNGGRPQARLGPWARLRGAALRLWRAAREAMCRVICRWV
jgi:hypothetical protein